MSYFLKIDKAEQTQIAFLDDKNNQISYAELVKFCDKVSKIITRRSLVFHFSENSVASLSFYIACMNANSVPLLLSPNTDSELIKKLIDKYQPNYIVTSSKLASNFDCKKILEFNEFQLLIRSDYSHNFYNQLSLLLTTSGSTGSPKLVRHSFKNLIFSSKSISKFFEINNNDRAFCFLPMYYTMGLSVIHSHIYSGASLVLISSSMTDSVFWEFLKKTKPTTITGVPYSFEILKKLRFFRMKIPSLRILTQGGGKLPNDIYDDCLAYSDNNNVKFIPTYGQTEGTARMLYLDYKIASKKKGSIGKAIPGGSLSILNKQGVESTEGTCEGELIYRGPNVTLGYAESIEDLKLKDERNGILLTGDIVKRDCDGYYFITGRKSRFLKLYGIRISLDEIRDLIVNYLGIECACGGNDKKMIVLVTSINKVKEATDLIVNKTGLFHESFEVQYVKKIPRNEIGKIIFR